MWCGFFSQKKYPSRIFKRLSQHETFQNIPYFCALIHRNRNSRVLRSKRHFLNKLLSRRGRSVWGGSRHSLNKASKSLAFSKTFYNKSVTMIYVLQWVMMLWKKGLDSPNFTVFMLEITWNNFPSRWASAFRLKVGPIDRMRFTNCALA